MPPVHPSIAHIPPPDVIASRLIEVVREARFLRKQLRLSRAAFAVKSVLPKPTDNVFLIRPTPQAAEVSGAR